MRDGFEPPCFLQTWVTTTRDQPLCQRTKINRRITFWVCIVQILNQYSLFQGFSNLLFAHGPRFELRYFGYPSLIRQPLTAFELPMNIKNMSKNFCCYLNNLEFPTRFELAFSVPLRLFGVSYWINPNTYSDYENFFLISTL